MDFLVIESYNEFEYKEEFSYVYKFNCGFDAGRFHRIFRCFALNATGRRRIRAMPLFRVHSILRECGMSEMDPQIIYIIRSYLFAREVIHDSDKNPVRDRLNGKTFSINDHIRGLVYSLLTNQRPWSQVVPKLSQIDALFFYYDPLRIKQMPGEYFEKGIRNLRCGNRNIHNQMQGLSYDITVFEKIVRRYGSMDAYVTSKPAQEIVKDISSGQYKLKGVGEALAWEYIRNVGVDGAKPDTHLCRFMGAERMGVSNYPEATTQEVYDEVERLHKVTGLSRFDIDYTIWTYCADEYGEVCTKVPHCDKCVVRNYCHKGQMGRKADSYQSKNGQSTSGASNGNSFHAGKKTERSGNREYRVHKTYYKWGGGEKKHADTFKRNIRRKNREDAKHAAFVTKKLREQQRKKEKVETRLRREREKQTERNKQKSDAEAYRQDLAAQRIVRDKAKRQRAEIRKKSWDKNWSVIKKIVIDVLSIVITGIYCLMALGTLLSHVYICIPFYLSAAFCVAPFFRTLLSKYNIHMGLLKLILISFLFAAGGTLAGMNWTGI